MLVIQNKKSEHVFLGCEKLQGDFCTTLKVLKNVQDDIFILLQPTAQKTFIIQLYKTEKAYFLYI